MITSELARPRDGGGNTTAPMLSLDAAGYWRAVMDVSPDAIVVLSGDDGRVLQASRSFLQLLGCSLAELECLRSGAWDAPTDEVRPGFLSIIDPSDAKVVPPRAAHRALEGDVEVLGTEAR